MGVKIVGEVERLDAKKLSYHEFAVNYMKENQPVVLTGLMDGWQACKDWVKKNGEPNLEFFSTHFGKSKVQVADCGRREFTDQRRKEMSVSDFIGHWQGLVDQSGDDSLLYLKDWHFPKEYPDYTAYTTPSFFLDDWLNMYLDSYHMHKEPDAGCNSYALNCSDYRFVYMGSRGTWTPLHADVFRSYSWSANVCGKKVWHFLSPSQSHLVFDRNLKNTVYDIFDNVPDKQFPGFKETAWLRCTQERNEIIFVPSGWYHQVQNLEDTISINHNWFNAYNLSWVWDLLVKDYNEAKEYIEDVRDICNDFEGLCQRNLAANTGMNFPDFFMFLIRFAIANTTQLDQLLEDKIYNIISLTKAHHLVSNLLSIHKVADSMKLQEFFRGNKRGSELGQNGSVFPDIKKLFKENEFQELSMTVNRIYDYVASSVKPDDETTKSVYASQKFSTVKDLEGDAEEWGITDHNYAEDLSFNILNPEDLLRCINRAVNTFWRSAFELELIY